MASERTSSLKVVPIGQVRENPIALRAVNKQDEAYTGLVESIRLVGVMNPITVREMRDAETGQKYYSLIDGLHRYNAAQDAGLEEIPAHILTLDEVQVLEAQLMANIHKVETRPVEYSKQLNRILGHNPTMTQTELAVKLGKSPTWIGQRLGLLKLDGKVAKLVEEGSITLNNAYVLAKLPPDEQGPFVERAMTMPPAEFTPTVNARVKEIRDAKRQGREAAPTEFVPVPHLRKMVEIRGELEQVTVGPDLIKQQGLRTPSDIWKAAIAWTLHMDPDSITLAKAKDEARKSQEAADKQARADERAQRKAAAASAAQASVTAGA